MSSSDEIGISVVVDAAQATSTVAEFKAKLTELTGSAENADSAVQRLGAAQREAAATTRVWSQATREAREAAEEAREKLERIGQIFNRGVGGRRFATELRMAKEAFGSLGDESLSTGQKMQAAAGGVMMAAQAIQQLWQRASAAAQRILELAVGGDELSRRYQQLAGDVEGLRNATSGAVGVMGAFQASEALAQHGLEAHGLVLEHVTRAAREFGIVHGGSTQERVQELASAIASGNTVVLRRYHLDLSSATDATSRMGLASQQLADQQSRSPPIPETLAETIDRVKNDFLELAQNVVTAGRIFAQEHPTVQALGDAFGWVMRHVHGANADLQEYIRQHGGVVAAHTENADAAENTAGKTERLASASREAASAQHELKDAINSTRAALQMTDHGLESETDALVRMIENGRHAVNEQIATQQRARAAARQLILEHHGQNADVINSVFGVSGGHGGGGADHLRDTLERLHELEERAKDVGAEFAGLDRRRGESAAHYAQREVRAVEESIRARQHELEVQRHIDQELERLAHARDRKDEEHKRELRRREQAVGASDNVFAHATESRRDQTGEVLRELNTGAQTQEQVMRHIEQLRQRAAAAIRSGAADAHEVVENSQREARVLGQAVAQFRDANSLQHQLATQFAQNHGLMATSAERFASVAHQAYGTATSAMKQHIVALLEGKESGMQALAGMTKAVLENLAEQGVEQAIAETAAGIANLAVFNYGGAALHFASAAAWGLLGAGSGIASAAIPSPSASPTTAGAGLPSPNGYANPPSASGGGGSDGGGGNTTIILQFGGQPLVTREHVEDAVHHLLRGLETRARIRPGMLRT